MSYIDLFSEGVAHSQAFDRLTDADSLPSDEVVSPSIAPFNGEFSYDLFGITPTGAGTHPNLAFKGQVTNDLVNWQDVPGLVWGWNFAADFFPGGNRLFGVRVANGRIPKVQIASTNSLGADNSRQHRRWVVTGTGGGGSWALDRFFLSWALHKGSTPEDDNSGLSQFSLTTFQPGRRGLKLDFGY